MATASQKDTAKQMKKYLEGCQQFFEATLIDIVFKQPEDIHDFLLHRLNDMSYEERTLWKRKMGKFGGDRPPTATTSSASAPPVPEKKSLQLVLRLSIVPGEDAFKQTLQVLEDLRRNGKAMPGCLHFEIYKGNDNSYNNSEVVLLQTWENQQSLDDYHSSNFFEQTTNKFAGLLTEQPDFKVFTHHKAL